MTKGDNAAENPADFYLGNGDQDYAVIRYFDPTSEDAVYLAGKPEDYTLETIDKSVHISKNGDLIGIVENVTKLIADGLFTENGLLLFAPTKDGDVIARVENGENLKFVQIKSDIPGTNALVAVEYEGLTPAVPSEPIFGTSVDDILTINQGNQLVFAGSGNDLIDATASSGNNRFYGGTGDDTFIFGTGDKVFGEAGSDRFFARTSGGNTLTGGEGADQFWIATAEIPQDVNTITDFTIGEDVIGIAGSGGSFGKLTFTQQNQDLLVSLSGSNLAVLQGIEAANLGSNSFAFI
jgi:Ca2+-binding RTX toxin-like protein